MGEESHLRPGVDLIGFKGDRHEVDQAMEAVRTSSHIRCSFSSQSERSALTSSSDRLKFSIENA